MEINGTKSEEAKTKLSEGMDMVLFISVSQGRKATVLYYLSQIKVNGEGRRYA